MMMPLVVLVLELIPWIELSQLRERQVYPVMYMVIVSLLQSILLLQPTNL